MLALRALAVLAGSYAPSAGADSLVFNTNTLSFTDNGAPATSLNGTPLTSVVVANGVASFYFGGNLNFGATDTVTAVGGAALAIEAGNNVRSRPAPRSTYRRRDRQAGPGAARAARRSPRGLEA